MKEDVRARGVGRDTCCKPCPRQGLSRCAEHGDGAEARLDRPSNVHGHSGASVPHM